MLAVEIAVDSSRDKVRVVMVYPSPEFNEKIRILHENGHTDRRRASTLSEPKAVAPGDDGLIAEAPI